MTHLASAKPTASRVKDIFTSIAAMVLLTIAGLPGIVSVFYDVENWLLGLFGLACCTVGLIGIPMFWVGEMLISWANATFPKFGRWYNDVEPDPWDILVQTEEKKHSPWEGIFIGIIFMVLGGATITLICLIGRFSNGIGLLGLGIDTVLIGGGMFLLSLLDIAGIQPPSWWTTN